MKAVVIGSGLIGCGLVGQLLRASGHEVVFVACDQILVDHFNRLGRYQVRVVKGLETQVSMIEGIRAVPTAEPDRVAEEIAGAGLIVTAVGGGNLPPVAPLIADDQSHLEEIISRFENAALNDPIARVGRDPQRKLGSNDRLVGAARLAEEAGIRPKSLALAAAAALYFYDPADPSAIDLQREVRQDGPGLILGRVSRLDSSQGLGRFVTNIWRRLAEGWQKGNLLLSLDKLQWAWEV